MLILAEMSGVPPASCAQAPAAPAIRILWSRPVRPPVFLAITPDAKYAAVIGRDGSLSYYDANGGLLWRMDGQGATSLAMSDDGQTIVTYTTLNPALRGIRIIGGDGRVRWTQTVAGCVWSAAVSRDGATAVVGTGNRRVYVYSLGGRKLRYRRRLLPGIPMSLALTPDGQAIAAGMWQESGVGMYTLKGKELWRAKGKIDLQYTAHLSRNGRYVLGRGDTNRPSSDVTLALWQADGLRRWQKRLKVGDVRAALSADATVVAASYRETIGRPGKRFSERRLALFNRSGKRLWEKGGMFSKPELMALLPGNRILASSENKMLYLLDASGRAVSKTELPARIRSYFAAEAAGRTLVYCGDGYAYMISASP